MATVAQAFDDFMRRLELTDSQQDKASRQHNDLRSRVRERLGGVEYDFLVGSYARRTAIRPLNDIDLFIVLDPHVNSDRHGRDPIHILDRVQSALRGCYPAPGPQVRLQGRSVNIEFTGSGIGYDVIPAFAVSSGRTGDREDMIYEIPDRDRKAWIRTNPARHRQQCIEANQRAGGMLNRLIKAAKHWNQGQRDANGKPLRSFHLEVMAYEAFQAKPIDERRGLRELLRFLASRVLQRCPDPAGLGPHVDTGMGPEERLRIQQKLVEAEHMAGEAIWHEERKDHASACRFWRSLLGSEFQF